MPRPELTTAARPDPYRVLDVPVDADAATISRAYWKLAKQFHPDRNGSALGQRLMLVVNDAYETLKNPERRAVWDRSRRDAAGRGLAAASRPVAGPPQPAASSARPAAPTPPPFVEAPSGPFMRRMAQQHAPGSQLRGGGRRHPLTRWNPAPRAP